MPDGGRDQVERPRDGSSPRKVCSSRAGGDVENPDLEGQAPLAQRAPAEDGQVRARAAADVAKRLGRHRGAGGEFAQGALARGPRHQAHGAQGAEAVLEHAPERLCRPLLAGGAARDRQQQQGLAVLGRTRRRPGGQGPEQPRGQSARQPGARVRKDTMSRICSRTRAALLELPGQNAARGGPHVRDDELKVARRRGEAGAVETERDRRLVDQILGAPEPKLKTRRSFSCPGGRKAGTSLPLLSRRRKCPGRSSR